MDNGTMILEKAFSEGRNTLSEHESKELIKSYGIPVTREIEVRNLQELNEAVKTIRFPLVMKSSSSRISHKSERGLVKLDIRNQAEADSAFKEITSVIEEEDGAVLVQEMIRGGRELMAGLIRDPQFGPCVMFGLGGIFTEILKDISFRVAPLEKKDALEMMREIRSHRILEAVRGMEAADIDAFSDILIKVGRIGLENESVKEIDINP